VDELRRRVAADRAAGLRPFCVVANAGTTNTGAVDPLNDLADFCRDEDLWLHADGAYGAAAVLCEEGRNALAGLDRVDSLSIDPHKWLFQPYECGCVLVRDWKSLFHTFRITAEYMEDALQAAADVSFQDLGIQLTRSFRALKVWMSMRTFGLPAFREAIRHGIRLAELAEHTALRHGFEVTSPARLGIVTFRYLPPGSNSVDADAANDAIVKRTLAEGFATVTSTRIGGRKVLRMCTINPRTTDDDIHQTILRLKATAEAISSDEQSSGGPVLRPVGGAD
jgi:glutamate/tyrosine decarboxylase-like PLP-dependent enzyme